MGPPHRQAVDVKGLLCSPSDAGLSPVPFTQYALMLLPINEDTLYHQGLYGAAVASKKLGHQKEAKLYFEKLIQLAEGVDTDRVEIEEARGVVGAYKMGAPAPDTIPALG